MSPHPDEIRSIIRAQFPSVRGADVAWLGEGCDSTAFIVDDAWVFRFPKRADVEQQFLRELCALPVLAPELPVPVPEYVFVGEPSALFPRSFGGYARLRGVPAHQLSFDAGALAGIGAQVGRFLSALHACNPAEIPGNLPFRSATEVLHDMQAEALAELPNLDRVSGNDLSARWRPYLARPVPSVTECPGAVVVHGDLAAEHILVEPLTNAVTGVIDWSEIALSSPAVDLAALFHWGGGEFAERVLRDYEHPVNAGLLEQARYIAVCRAVLDVTFGLETGRSEYLAGALRCLEGAGP